MSASCKFASTGFIAFAIASALGQTPLTTGEIQVRRQAESLKPTAAELRFQQVPWVLDLGEAIRTAKKENRPIFFWAAGGRDRDGQPLERC
jgi:hypothetical protein